MKLEWLLCPICKSETRLQLRNDTELKNFPLYCPKCKQESLIDVKELHITPDARRRADELVRYLTAHRLLFYIYSINMIILMNSFF